MVEEYCLRMNRRAFLATGLAAGSLSPLLAASVSEAAQGGAPDKVKDVQVLVFDTFGTVVDWRSAVTAEGEKLGRAKGLKMDWAAFADAWRAGYGPSMNRVRAGELPWTKLDDLHRMTLDGLLVKFKIDNLTEDEKKNFNKAWHRLKGWPDSVAGLTRLKKRYVLSPLSNGNMALLTDMAKFAGLPWDCILASDIARHYKPDKEMYLMPGEFFGIPPSSVMMVAAHSGDLDGAKATGLHTAFVHRPLEYGPTAKPPVMPEAGRFDFLAKDFNDLAAQLGL
jgi:2-haloacid dehalogenase